MVFSHADHSSSPNSHPLSYASPIYKKQPKREAGSVPDRHGAASAVDGDCNEVIQLCQQLADSLKQLHKDKIDSLANIEL